MTTPAGDIGCRGQVCRPAVVRYGVMTLVAAVCVGGCGHSGPTRVVFYPSAAQLDVEKDIWTLPVQGWVYAPRQLSPVRGLGWWWLKRGLEPDQEAEARERFHQRADLFLVDGRSGRHVMITLDGQRHLSPPSDSAGRFAFDVSVPVERAQALAQNGVLTYEGELLTGPISAAKELIEKTAEAVGDADESKVEVEDRKDRLEQAAPSPSEVEPAGEPAAPAKVSAPATPAAPVAPAAPAKVSAAATPAVAEKKAGDDKPRFFGTVRLVHPEGWGVISDIDDTIKISHVSDRARNIRSTFLDPFEAVEGMPEAYRRWAAADPQAVFFYVSSSPQQLYEALNGFIEKQSFPFTAFSLKRIGFFDSYMSNLWSDSWQNKPKAIEHIFKRFPGRDFILIGDSIEQDPEIFAEMARQHPEQVRHIYIRSVNGPPRDSARYRQAFESVAPQRWSLIENGDDLPPEPPTSNRGEMVRR